MNKSSEVICLQFISYGGIPFKTGIFASELLIDWGDGNKTYYQGKKYYTIAHHYQSEGLQKIRIEGQDIIECNVSNLNLTELTLFHCPALESLDCSINELTCIDLQACPALEELYCNSNNLKELNLSCLAELSVLDASHNCLEELDVAHSPFIRSVQCSYNHLNQINLGNCKHISNLNISHNFLERDQLDYLFQHLPPRQENAIIAYLNNPGTIFTDTQILKLKKWL